MDWGGGVLVGGVGGLGWEVIGLGREVLGFRLVRKELTLQIHLRDQM